MELEKLLTRIAKAELNAESRDRALAQSIFQDWRDRYVANLCGYMRTLWECEQVGLQVKPFRSREWCNAAVHFLSHADLQLQDYFLRSIPDVKDKIVDAVIEDGGCMRQDGFWCELAPL